MSDSFSLKVYTGQNNNNIYVKLSNRHIKRGIKFNKWRRKYVGHACSILGSTA